ncbi:MAG: methyltransferase, partial [Proteobacteria bacterium]|nr:methyltransferase [Pseudomonadota bacterium]
ACTSFDLAPVVPVAKRHVEAMGAMGRVEVMAGDFFKDPLPKADVITMGNILHDWNEAEKLGLIKKAFDALPSGGRLIAIENVIDDARRENTFGLLMSLNMLIELPGGFDYTGAQFDGWCKAAGFQRTEVVPLAGPTSAAIAYKA